MGLKHLTASQVLDIAAKAEALNKTSPPIPLGVMLSTDEFNERVKRYAESPEHKALHTALDALSFDQLIEMQGVMLLGRGDLGNTLQDVLNQLPTFDPANKNQEIDYVVEKAPALPAYLLKGLELFRLEKN